MRFGLTFSAMTYVAGNVRGYTSIGTTAAHSAVAFTGNSASGSVLYSAPGGAAANVMPFGYYALMRASVAGTVQLQAGASTTTGAIHIEPGSFIKMFQIG